MTSRRNSIPSKTIPQHWARQIEAVLAEQDQIVVPVPDPASLSFDVIWRWLTTGILPLIVTVGTLRGEPTKDAKALLNQVLPVPHNPETNSPFLEKHIRTVWEMQARLAFPYDTSFAAAHSSALTYAQGNSEMITEHFGTAGQYAETYAETNTDAMVTIAQSGVGGASGDLMVTALKQRSTDAYAQTFPGAFLRGLIMSYVSALGPMPPSDLAASLRIKLHTATLSKTIP